MFNTLSPPPEQVRRWTAGRKAEIVIAVNAERISAADACRRYDLHPDELAHWQELFTRHGSRGLRTTHAQKYRRLRLRKETKAMQTTRARSIAEQEQAVNRARLLVVAHRSGLRPPDLQAIVSMLRAYPRPAPLPPVPLTYGDACLRDVFPALPSPAVSGHNPKRRRSLKLTLATLTLLLSAYAANAATECFPTPRGQECFDVPDGSSNTSINNVDVGNCSDPTCDNNSVNEVSVGNND